MEIELTKDAQHLVAVTYKLYLERRKSGISKLNAKLFDEDELREREFRLEAPADFSETVREMCRVFGCKQYVVGTFSLSDQAIVYMENRFKNGLKDVLSFLAQFIP